MSKDADPSDDDGYEAGYQAAKIVPQEFVQDALDFSCGYFDCLRDRSSDDYRLRLFKSHLARAERRLEAARAIPRWQVFQRFSEISDAKLWLKCVKAEAISRGVAINPGD